MYDAVAAQGQGETEGTFPPTQFLLKRSYLFLLDFINFKFKHYKFSLNFSKLFFLNFENF